MVMRVRIKKLDSTWMIRQDELSDFVRDFERRTEGLVRLIADPVLTQDAS